MISLKDIINGDIFIAVGKFMRRVDARNYDDIVFYHEKYDELVQYNRSKDILNICGFIDLENCIPIDLVERIPEYYNQDVVDYIKNLKKRYELERLIKSKKDCDYDTIIKSINAVK